MAEEFDFERDWQERLSRSLLQIAGPDVRDQVLAGSEDLDAASDSREVIDWSQGAMERLDALVDPELRRRIMTGCACQYPTEGLLEARQEYERSGDISRVHELLRLQFRGFLRDALGLDDGTADEVLRRGWGLAGVLAGDRIVATKIPKSGNLAEYLGESDAERRRELYCHCPRVRDALQTDIRLSPTYCYCGAGFYKGIWEEILQQPVEVELLASVLQGDEVCQVAINLPSGGC